MKQKRMVFFSYNYAELVWKKRILIVFLIEFIGLHFMLDKAVVNAASIGDKYSIFDIFPFLVTNTWSVWLILLGWFLLVCDYPYRKDGYMYYMIRSSRYQWLLNQILFLVSLAITYIGGLFILGNLILFPYIQLENQWGISILRGAGDTSYLAKNGAVVVYEDIVKYLTPVQACVRGSLLLFGLLMVVGMLFMVCNLLHGKYVGYAVVVVMLGLDGMQEGTVWNQIFLSIQQYVNPISLGRNLKMESIYYTGLPDFGYCIGLLMVYIIALCIWVKLRIKKVDFN
ncbi:MAG: hypothetical protein II992_07755 [Lachnospiraceae bacterium]|nr:hypothetical protein [Lachnospiraceae bacterium]